MLWVYVLLLTMGVVFAVPNLARRAAREDISRVEAALGAFGLVSGIVGLVLGFTRAGGGTTLAVAVVIGIVAAGISAEVRSLSPAKHSTKQTAIDTD